MYTHRYAKLACVVALIAAVALTGGCAKKTPINPELGTQSTPTTSDNDNNAGLNTSLDLSKLPFQKAADLETIHFDYNQFVLRADAVQKLNANAEKMKAKPVSTVWRIEGNCDERGTQEYNLALGEKRALAVREYLMKLGVPGDRVITISYGEENPVQDGHDESAWKFNRRAEFGEATIPQN